MIKIIICFWATFVCTFGLCHAENTPPEMVVNHNRISGEVKWETEKSYMHPIVAMDIYLFPIKGSSTVASINAGEVVKLISIEMHSFPANGKVIVKDNIPEWRGTIDKSKRIPSIGEYIYILFHAGEGDFFAWYEGNIINIPGQGVSGLALDGTNDNNKVWAEYKGLKNRGEELWICVRKETGQEGWLKFTNKKDWYLATGTQSIFHFNH